ncbi:MAG: protein phosphatase 2C domain-containing protein [Gammaproteobacteria bacterium]
MPLSKLYTATSLASPELLQFPGVDLVVCTRVSPTLAHVNEDGVLVLDFAEQTLVVAVADGAGGYPDGGSASALALAALDAACHGEGELQARAAILNGFEAAHQAIKDHGAGGATTLAVIEVVADTLRTYHAGDSGILVVGQRGRVKLQSVFHSPTGYAVEAGLLDEEEALHHEHRHMVSNLLGMEPMSVAIGSPITLARRDTVVIASDGLYDNLYVPEIIEIVRKGPLLDSCWTLVDTACARMLAAAPGQPSKPDDLSVVLLRRAAD